MHVHFNALPTSSEATLPQRFLNPMTAYLLAAISQSPWLLLAQGAAAAFASYWQPLDDSFKVLAVAMVADFLTGTFAAIRRRRFTFRACWEGMVAKLMVLVLVCGVGYVSHSVPGAGWVWKLLNFSMAAIDATSTLKNFRVARVKLPSWLEALVARVEKTLTSEAATRLGGAPVQEEK